jgi:SAM-dependent methyltransferase
VSRPASRASRVAHNPDTSPRPPFPATHRRRPELKDLLLPLMICSPDGVLEAAGLPSLRSSRHSRTAAFIGARHLDIACGSNFLKGLKPGSRVVGIDVQVARPKFDPTIVGRAERLPFADESFDSVSMIACLNHFGERSTVIEEARRVLKPGGLVIVTMIGPLVGLVCHKFRFWYQDTLYRSVHPAEVDGMERPWVENLFQASGMPCVHQESFLAGLNRMFLFEKPAPLPN